MSSSLISFTRFAEIAQLVEHNLAKVRVASSSLVFRSLFFEDARMVESVDTRDLKSLGHCGCAGSSPASSTKIYRQIIDFNCLAIFFVFSSPHRLFWASLFLFRWQVLKTEQSVRYRTHLFLSSFLNISVLKVWHGTCSMFGTVL